MSNSDFMTPAFDRELRPRMVHHEQAQRLRHHSRNPHVDVKRNSVHDPGDPSAHLRECLRVATTDRSTLARHG